MEKNPEKGPGDEKAAVELLWKNFKNKLHLTACGFYAKEKGLKPPLIKETNLEVGLIQSLRADLDSYCHYASRLSQDAHLELEKWAQNYGEQNIRPHLVKVVDQLFSPRSYDSKHDPKGYDF